MKTRIRKLKNRYPLHIQITILFTILIVSIGSIIILFSHSQLTKLAEISTHQRYQQTGEAIGAELNSVTRAMASSVNILAKMPVSDATTESQRMAQLSNFILVLQQNNYASSVYSAWDNGDFFILRRLTNQSRALFKSPANAQWLVQNYQRDVSPPEKKEFYLDDKQNIISAATVPYDNYDPRTRKWYELARDDTRLFTSPNYIFKATGETGFTYSQQADNQHAVIGLDVSLASLSAFLQQQGLPPGSQAAVLSESDEIIASQPARTLDNSGGLIPVLQPLLVERDDTGSRIFSVDNEDWYGSVIHIHSMGNDYRLAIATPADFLTTDASSISNRATLIAFLLLLFSLPIIWYFSRKISQPLLSLRKDAEEISKLHFEAEEHPGKRSIIEEIDDLHTAMAKMKQTLIKFISMGSMLSVKNNFTQQMQGLLTETTEIADMTGGMVFLSNPDVSFFTPVAFRWREENINFAEIPPLAVDPEQGDSFWQILHGQTVSGTLTRENIPDSLLTFLLPHLPLRYVAVPMQTHDNHPMGFLLLFNTGTLTDKRESAKIQLINSLVGMLSVAIEAQHLLVEQKKLMNAFIKLIAGAIDEKSPYTGGHCQRVPVITKMLAKAAVDTREGPFANFTLSENEWDELHTACWLHDCGKITTPEAVVDKATKLELIYNRIHEIRMRFELLKREKEIEFLRQTGDNGSHKNGEIALEDTLRQLDDDFYFIARCNIGGEFLSDDALARINRVANYHWTRTLDDTVGISQDELTRKKCRAGATLPVQEPMLADKEEHIVYRTDVSKEADKYNFKLKKPVLQYNYGEIYNLTIRRGTLNDEERYKINEHIMQTIIMLDNLPFPRTMANVPTIAGGHHERVDGKGYPYQLNHSQMSIQVRMLAIADVFEALTAIDRPYKPGKLLSEALSIMASMVNEQHLDRDLFILFLQSGIWREYAHTYLDPEKTDSVNVASLLEKVKPQFVEDKVLEANPA